MKAKKLRRFNKNGIHPISVMATEEIVCHGAQERKTGDGDTVLVAECRIVLETSDGRLWNSVVEVELHHDGVVLHHD